MSFLGLSASEKKELEYELIPYEVRLTLIRIIRASSNFELDEIKILRQNKFINIANNVMRKPIYVLNSDDLGHYMLVEHAWHTSEVELIMRTPDTIEFIEILADYIQEGLLDIFEINNILHNNNCSFYYEEKNNKVAVVIIPLSEIEPEVPEGEITNVRKLVDRMNNHLESDDFPGVLHSSASIFETLAKDIIDRETIEDETLGSFFELYRNESYLPEPIIDYILYLYNKRSTEPLAAHGSRKDSDITKNDAIIIFEMTKAIIKMERKLMENRASSQD